MKEVVIAGVGMHPFGRWPDKDVTDIALDAVVKAINDANMSYKDVQFGICGTVLSNERGTGVQTLVRLGLTGPGAPALADPLGVRLTNEMIAIVSAAAVLLPEARTIIDVGGEDSKILCLRKPERGELVLDDFATNSACAAGLVWVACRPFPLLSLHWLTRPLPSRVRLAASAASSHRALPPDGPAADNAHTHFLLPTQCQQPFLGLQ